MSAYSPLRYPGGKGKVAPYIAEVIELNDLLGGHYIEPFAGGAGVALELLFSERVSRIHINDIDKCVYAFWHSAVYETDALVEMIRRASVSVEGWLTARDMKRNPESCSRLELGFATFFLSRTNRSGILNGGVVGGLSQTGKWKIDCRFNKDELISRVRRIGFYSSRISVLNMDASELISSYIPAVEGKALIYLDPPYYIKGAYLYQNHYDHNDHANLLSKIRTTAHKWIVSYDNVPEISELYSDFEQECFGIDYTARKYSRGAEIMIYSPKLLRPARVYCSKKERRIQETASV